MTSRNALRAAMFGIIGLVVCEPTNAEEFEVDSGHSAVVFRVKHLGVSYCYGRFNELSGSFNFEKSQLNIELKAASIDTNSKKRDDHLRGPDFFDVGKFPLIRYTGKEFRKTGADKLEVTGELTLHGVTNPVTVELDRVGSAEDPWGGYRSGFEVTFTIKRSEYGMGHMTGALGDDVRIVVSVEGVRK